MALHASKYSIPKPPPLARFFASTPMSVLIYLVVIIGIIYSAYNGAQAMGYNWQWYRVPKYFFTLTDEGFQWGEIAVGLVKTIELSALSFLLAIVLGLVIALLRLSGLIVGTRVALVFLEIVRNTPILVLLYLFYYVLGPIFDLNRYTASILCLGVYHGALISEIFRAGINSVRFMLPPLTGEAVNMIKSSAIVSVIAVVELTTIGRNIISDTYMSFEIWFTIAAVYMVVTLILSVGVSYVEKRYTVR